MRIKLIKTILFVIVTFLCMAIAIGAKYYVKSVQSFKINLTTMEQSMQNNNDACYFELKNSIKESYAKKFVALLNQTSLEFSSEFNKILGDKYVNLKNEEKSLEQAIAEERNAFFETDEYKNAKLKVNEIKLKLDNSSEEQKDEFLDEFRNALTNLSTLNTKLNNSLKGYRDRLEGIKVEMKSLFNDNQSALVNARDSVMNNTREKLFQLLSNYNLEIKELNLSFNKETNIKEYPFDINSLNTVSVCGKIESEYFNELAELNYKGSNSVSLLCEDNYKN